MGVVLVIDLSDLLCRCGREGGVLVYTEHFPYVPEVGNAPEMGVRSAGVHLHSWSRWLQGVCVVYVCQRVSQMILNVATTSGGASYKSSLGEFFYSSFPEEELFLMHILIINITFKGQK